MVAFIDRMMGQIAGQEIAVLGERETGKTHLQHFLHTRKIPPQYTQTFGMQKIQPGVARLIVIDGASGQQQKTVLRLSRTYDVPGSAEAIESWKAVVERAAILLYLFRADYVFHKDQAHLKRVREDADALARILRGSPRRLKGAALIRARQVLAAQLPATPALVVGAMKTLPQTQELLYRLFAQELKIGK